MKFMMRPLLPDYASHPCRENFEKIYPTLKSQVSGHDLWKMVSRAEFRTTGAEYSFAVVLPDAIFQLELEYRG